ncbi:MAG TPA: OsmC family protein [Ignavibacteriaceae bacterium]|nr:OsmC family protein [Ignavibacteriaceae bacterium]
MNIITRIENSYGSFKISLQTGQRVHSIDIPSKSSGFGSDVNGGEMLFLAMAVCYCNDLYREAAKTNIEITNVEVEVKGEFGSEGEPAKNVTYNAKVAARADKKEIQKLMKHTDKVAEIQNTIRNAIPVRLKNIEAIPE